MTDETRKEFQESTAEWQRELGNDLDRTHILGVHAYGSTTPIEVQIALAELWGEASIHAGPTIAAKTPKILGLDLSFH